MTLDRTEIVSQNFIHAVRNDCLPNIESEPQVENLGHDTLISLFDSQIKSRLLDFKARELKEKGQSFYTIGSSGHEGNAVMGNFFPYTDMAFLHYRSGAFFIERAKQLGINGVEEILLSLTAAKEDAIASGRHKVFGSLPLNIPPQTSTIASHLPKALGAALSIRHKRDDGRVGQTLGKDSLVLVSFGDASFNHASAQTTLNAASRFGYLRYPLPIIFICEDNGIGISVPTPNGWIEASMAKRLGFHYVKADGRSLLSLWQACQEADFVARKKRQPVFLHMHCRRLLGHAGSDIEQQYLSLADIETNEAHCPLLVSAASLIQQNVLSRGDILSLYQRNEEEINTLAQKVLAKEKLRTATEIMSSIAPVMKNVQPLATPTLAQRQALFKEKFSHLSLKRTMQQLINLALTDLLLTYKNALIFGEDVGKKGGVYRVTADLQKQFGTHRVFDTILDETTILGTAIGYAHNGFLPVPEIQFLAYLHNAEDQLRGEAATLSFFSSGLYKNPMVIRIASLAYQKGFGGHFHNDNSIAVLRDIPGLIIACPSRGDNAVKLLRECFRLAYFEGRVVVFLEPIALYMVKDLQQKGDDGWLTYYPDKDERIASNDILVDGQGKHLIISYGNGIYLANQAKNELVARGISVTILDLLWLKPLAIDKIIDVVRQYKSVLIVDEGRKTGSISEELIAEMVTHLGKDMPNVKRLTGEDSFITLGESWASLLPSVEKIIALIEALEGEA